MKNYTSIQMHYENFSKKHDIKRELHRQEKWQKAWGRWEFATLILMVLISWVNMIHTFPHLILQFSYILFNIMQVECQYRSRSTKTRSRRELLLYILVASHEATKAMDVVQYMKYFGLYVPMVLWP